MKNEKEKVRAQNQFDHCPKTQASVRQTIHKLDIFLNLRTLRNFFSGIDIFLDTESFCAVNNVPFANPQKTIEGEDIALVATSSPVSLSEILPETPIVPLLKT